MPYKLHPVCFGWRNGESTQHKNLSLPHARETKQNETKRNTQKKTHMILSLCFNRAGCFRPGTGVPTLYHPPLENTATWLCNMVVTTNVEFRARDLKKAQQMKDDTYSKA
ncbi:unnamed protein product, partial [Ectocarpus sp. 13 AM-2016]